MVEAAIHDSCGAGYDLQVGIGFRCATGNAQKVIMLKGCVVCRHDLQQVKVILMDQMLSTEKSLTKEVDVCITIMCHPAHLTWLALYHAI
jgi:hypothetical protein